MHASPFAPLVELPSADTATWRPNAGEPRLAFRAGRIPADPSRLRGYRLLRFILDLTGFLVAWKIASLLSGLQAMGESSGLFSGSALPAALSPLGSDWVSLPFALCFLGAVCVGAKRMAEGRELPRPSGIPGMIFVAGALTLAAVFVSSRVGGGLSLSLAISFALLTCLALKVSSLLASAAASFIQRGWPRVERVAVVARNGIAADFVEELRSNGSHLAGVIVPPNGRGSVRRRSVRRSGRTVLGDTNQLAAIINRCAIDRLIFLDEGLERRLVLDGLAVARRMGIRAACALTPLAGESHVRLSEYCGLRVLDIRPTAFARPRELIKRLFDIAAGSALLLLLSPFLILLALMVKLSSPGPVLHSGPRVGKGGRYFTLYKFRSMCDESGGRSGVESRNEKNGHLFKIRNDPRVTPVGAFLRRYSLDEFPQLFNVLAGHMSLVGPRPLPAEDLEPDGQSREFRAWARARSEVPPGITGLWEVSGRSSLPFEDMVELDLDYIRRWSLGFDLKILLETPRAVLSGRGAY